MDTNQNTLSLPTSTNSVVCPHSVSFLKSDELPVEKVTEKCNSNDISTQGLYSITLKRGPNGFGFSVRSGYSSNNSPLIVYRIIENGPAYEQGQMQVSYIQYSDIKFITHG
ncbi:unnamed protein product [Trichobilharzia regenti]|nr:unnamed protein product [Trichobilharzia regenti]